MDSGRWRIMGMGDGDGVGVGSGWVSRGQWSNHSRNSR